MMDIPASPPTFSFPRITRRRRHTNAGASPSQATPGTGQPSPPSAQPPSQTTRSPAADSAPVTPSVQQTINPLAMPNTSAEQPTSELDRQTYRIRLVPHLESARSLHFEPIIRDVKVSGPPLRVGRFTDRATNPPRGNGLNPNDKNSDKVAFRSKVVSRAHAELWVQGKGMFFLKDTKSSSGTFINHMRLSPPGQESVAHILKDGDVIQLGVDYQGGTEEMYRCVKIKVEVGQGREWQGGANAFNTAALKQLRTLQAGDGSDNKTGPLKKTVGDCCICLFGVSVCQSLFIAPCSHAFHYKCIRPMLELHHPGFSCPLCRTFADLEADVEVDEHELKAIADALDEAEDSEQPPAPGLPYANGGLEAGRSRDDAILVDSDEGGASPQIQRAANGHTLATGHHDPMSEPIGQPSAISVVTHNVNGNHRNSAVDDDRLVEDALEVDYDGEDDDGDGDERMVDDFGGRNDDDPMDDTVSPTKRYTGGYRGSAGAGPSTAPLKIDPDRRTDVDTQADREAREFANATTPLNNTFIAMANSLLGTVEHPSSSAQYGHADHSLRSSGAAVAQDDDDATGTEAENGYFRQRPSRRAGLELPAGGARISSSGNTGNGGPAGGTARGGALQTQALPSP
ncbi:hypothetical protein FRB94_010688 [Tulasnella sp. JGI-2019a]|nr:hypothetical protein FRB94_010688 [Tulasnella sp. JGI-2019a]KAG9034914.1 hypothetical protein FRB95_012330 [Tulasnella sp. JGI-2019a]